MNIYFCEKCGTRVTSIDIEQGRGKQTPENKVFCQQCTQSTLEVASGAGTKKDSAKVLPVTMPRNSARNIQPVQRRDSSASIAPQASPSGRSAAAKPTAPHPPAPAKPNFAIIGGVAVAVLCTVVGIGVTVSRSGTTAPEKSTASKGMETRPNSNPVVDRPETPRNRGPETQPEDTPKPTVRAPEASPDEAFAKLVKFDGLKPDDTAGRIQILEDYLAKNPNSPQAARANLMLIDLRKLVNTVEPEPERPPIAPVAPVAVKQPVETPVSDVEKTPAPHTPPAGGSDPILKGLAPPQPAAQPAAQPAHPLFPPDSPEQIKLAGVRSELAPMLREFHFGAALEALERKLKDESVADIRDTLLKDRAELNEVLTLRQRAVDVIRATSDKNVKLKMGKLTIIGKPIEDAANTGLKMKLTDGPEMTVNIDDMDPQDIEAYAPLGAGAEKAEDLRRRGLMYLWLKDLVKAREYFKYAQNNGSESAAANTKRIDDIEAEEVEARARQEWTAAEALVNAKRWNEANTALTSFKNNQSKTKTYALAEEQFNKYMKEVEFALRPYLEGAAVSYFKGRDFNVTDKVLSRIERTVDFKLDGPKTIAKEVPHDNWCARWEGAIRVPTNGHYTFVVVVDDGIRLWIDGKGVLDDWRDSAAHRVTGQIDLTEGFHEFKLEYYQATGPSTCRFSWSLKNGFSEHIVPAEALCHREPPKDPPKK